MTVTDELVIDWTAFFEARQELGADFVRILGYFREDGIKSVASCESAMRAGDAANLVLPAHTLKGESRQFGADTLAELAEQIELVARRCVETRERPDEVLAQVARLRRVFEATLGAFETECNPLVARRPGFGRKPGPASNQGFGRL